MSSTRLDLTNLPLVSIPTSTSATGVTSTTVSTDTTGAVSGTRLNLFANSGYDGATEVTLDNGQTLSLPTLSGEEQSQVNALFGGLTSEQQLQLSDAGRKLAQALYAQVGYNPQAVTGSNSTGSTGTSTASAVGGVNAAGSSSVNSSAGAGSSDAAASVVQAAFAKALKQQSQVPGVAENDANNMEDDDSDDDDNSWAGGLQSAVPQMQQLGSTSSGLSAATQSSLSVAGAGSSVSTGSVNTQSSSVSTGSVNIQGSSVSVSTVGTQGSLSTAAQSRLSVAGGTQSSGTTVSSSTLTGNGLLGNGLASTSSGLGSGNASTSPTVSVATPAVVNNINSAGNQYNNATGNQDFDKTVQAVSYMGMLGLQGDLTNMANQVQSNVNMQNQTRTDLADVRQAIANWPDGTQTEHFTWTSYDQLGRPVQNSQDLTQAQAQALQSNLEDQLTSQSDMNQDQQLKLQDVTQKYQEAINTISNLLKYEHDTVKSIIQNIHT